MKEPANDVMPFAGSRVQQQEAQVFILCVAVAEGEKFLGYDTEQGIVLYLCLEDSYSRIKERAEKLTETFSENLYVKTMEDKRLSIASGLTKQIEKFIKQHPNTNLVVIDTLSIEQGMDIKTISHMLGHTDAGFTMNTYMHVTDAMQQNVADTMGKLLTEKKDDKRKKIVDFPA